MEIPMPFLSIILFAALVASEPGETMLEDPIQLTTSKRFVKAGESYFSDDGQRIIFQAIEQPERESWLESQEPDIHYSMFVAEVVRDADDRVIGIDGIRCISPAGSANTCGWFYPGRSDRVLFATTSKPPSQDDVPGYQRDSGDYKWQFPREMDIVAVDLAKADGSSSGFEPLVSDPSNYLAEGSISVDGRHLLYTSLATGEGDLYVKDLETGSIRCLVDAPGYDGGAFFSPDGRRITYRSDRNKDDLLQIFVSELAFDEDGAITGVEREFQLTDNGHVNWCPFWTADGRSLVYATSEMGHYNYEIFMIDAQAGDGSSPAKYGTGSRRVTNAPAFDGLPAFSSDGGTMIWTSKRSGEDGSQLWVAGFDPDAGKTSASAPPGTSHGHP
tara:strand:+ start:21832 stop:22992 length:1161 start_codon:yes stop_codon:yes gene_type:complete